MIHLLEMPSLWQTIEQAMRLNPAIFAEIQKFQGGLGIALLIVTLAGLSEALGQSVILFINRLAPRRFMLALMITAASHVVGYLVWTVTVWLVGVYVFGQQVSIIAIACVVSCSGQSVVHHSLFIEHGGDHYGGARRAEFGAVASVLGQRVGLGAYPTLAAHHWAPDLWPGALVATTGCRRAI